MVKKFWPVALKSAISGLGLGPEHPQICNIQTGIWPFLGSQVRYFPD